MTTNSQSNPRRFVFFALAAVFVAAVGLSVNAFSTTVEPTFTSARSGIVIDADTQKPLNGAHIVARWWHTSVNRFPPIGHGTVGGFANCLHREVTTTDASGRYTLPTVDGVFAVDRKVELSHKDEYHWQLDAYLVGYYSPTAMGPDRAQHPAVSGRVARSTVDVAPLLLTKDNRPREERIAYLAGWGLDFSCKWTTTDPVPFVAELYREAFQLACDSGPPMGALKVVALRQEARSAMPPLSKEITQGLDEIKSHYRPNEAVSAADNARVCELLTQAKEAAP